MIVKPHTSPYRSTTASHRAALGISLQAKMLATHMPKFKSVFYPLSVKYGYQHTPHDGYSEYTVALVCLSLELYKTESFLNLAELGYDEWIKKIKRKC